LLSALVRYDIFRSYTLENTKLASILTHFVKIFLKMPFVDILFLTIGLMCNGAMVFYV
jgi:hypothetical protein